MSPYWDTYKTKNVQLYTNHVFSPVSTQNDHSFPGQIHYISQLNRGSQLNKGPTERISYLVDHFLNPPSTYHHSYVKDTTHFLKLIRDSGIVPTISYLVTLDITLLYINICIPTGIQATKEVLEKFRPQTDLKPTNQSFTCSHQKRPIQLSTLQIKGCTMGTRVALVLQTHTWTNLKMIMFTHIIYNHLALYDTWTTSSSFGNMALRNCINLYII